MAKNRVERENKGEIDDDDDDELKAQYNLGRACYKQREQPSNLHAQEN